MVCSNWNTQYETHNEVLQTSLRESELKKQELEHSLATLNEQLLVLKEREEMLLASELDREQEHAGILHSANEVKRTLEKQMKQQRDTHLRQVEGLKTEIGTKETQIAQLNE